MTAWVALIGSAAVLLTAALALRRSAIGQRGLSNRAAWSTLAASAGAAVVLGIIAILPPPRRQSVAPVPTLPPGDYPVGALEIGMPAPPFEAEGWLNGSPPAPGAGGKVIVADLWALW